MKFPLKTTVVLLGALALGACDDDADLLAPEGAEAFEARSSKASPKKGEKTFAVALGAEGAEIIDGLFGLRPNAMIGPADISASNGIIHVIDQVIVPPTVVSTVLSLITPSGS